MNQGLGAVAAIEVFSLRLPFRRTFEHHLAARSESRPQIVRLRLSDGATGYGEALPRPYLTGETEASVRRALTGELGRLFMNRPVDGLDSAVHLLEAPAARRARERAPAAFCGLELALLDAAGRREGRPVTDILGPVRRQELPFETAVVGLMPLAALPLYLGRVRQMDKRVVKLKVGRRDDFRRVATARRVLGAGVELLLDANGAWKAAQAIERIRGLEPFRLAAVEQPVAREDLEGMAMVRRAVGTPIMADESICTPADARRLLEHQACDLWNLRVGKCGGLLGTLELVRMARANGIACQLGVLVGETGILGMAGRLLAACAADFRYLEHDSSGIKRVDVVRLPPVSGNAAHVPVGLPGLGIEVDARRLEALAESRAGLQESRPCFSGQG